VRSPRAWILVVCCAVAAGLFTAPAAIVAPRTAATSASAASASNFDPGDLIDDRMFFDGGAMSASDVQAFLVSQVPSCRSGYTCLRDYSQATASKPQVDYNCSAYQGAASESAATIIAKVGQACGISQKALLVLLEKEQSLVTDTWPTAGQYRSATGYGCPDTAACDSTYYGFFNQVYMAALQFKRYAANPTSWNHIAGMYNSIRYSPTTSCGSSQVFIQNQATAGLYNYTPYQPNAAALANLYGTGDSCSSYGNRNFWRIYSDWFGSPTVLPSVARTVSDPRVYVVSGSVKYLVPTERLLAAFGVLGGVQFVSQSYLDGFASGGNASRILRGPDGTIYFTDANYKLKLNTCQLVADYGGACAVGGYMQLSAGQIAAFTSGPAMTNVLGTTAGARYYVSGGVKREIADAASQASAGIPTAMNVLTEAALDGLSLGAPVVNDGSVVGVRDGSGSALVSAGASYPVDDATLSASGLVSRKSGSLWSSSLAKLTAGAAFTGVVQSGSGSAFILGGGTAYRWVPGGLPASAVSAAFVGSFPVGKDLTDGALLKSVASPRLYAVDRGVIRPILTMAAAASIDRSLNIVSLPDAAVAGMKSGATALQVGSLVRTQSNPVVYLIDGLRGKVPLASFDQATEAGFTVFSYADDGAVAAYASRAGMLSYGITCNGVNYAAAGGSLHALSTSLVAAYGLTYTSLDPSTCAQTGVGSAATQFIRTSDGQIWQMSGGVRHPVTSMDRYTQLNGPTIGYTSVSAGFAASLPLGANA
jgi:hypothetical protein